MTYQLQHDLNDILWRTERLWEELRGRRIFITGGTGFFGCWLLESFIKANDELGLNAKAVVLTRAPETFTRKVPHIARHPAIVCHTGDVRNFKFPDGPFSHVIHSATAASATLNDENPLLMFDTIIEGTRRVLDFTLQSGAKKFLLTSSGAVYGRQPPEMTNIPESYQGAPDSTQPLSAYGEGKRASELLCAIYAKQHGLEPKIARCFAFVGPYLSLDSHFAIGNFIGDALRGRQITVKGDGSPFRSYLYAADLAIWLWTVLLRGEPGRAYNVGSDRDRTIGEVASIVAECCGKVQVVIAKKANIASSPERYVPNIERAKAELKLTVEIDLREAICRTARYHAQQGGTFLRGRS